MIPVLPQQVRYFDVNADGACEKIEMTEPVPEEEDGSRSTFVRVDNRTLDFGRSELWERTEH